MVVAEEVEAAGYHEAGHAIMTLCLGGTINDEGVEIDERQNCGVRFQYHRGDSTAREFTQVLVNMAGWRAEYLRHGRGSSRSDRNSAELNYIISEVRDEASRHPDDEIEDGDDFKAFREMLSHNPDATDEELCLQLAGAWTLSTKQRSASWIKSVTQGIEATGSGHRFLHTVFGPSNRHYQDQR